MSKSLRLADPFPPARPPRGMAADVRHLIFGFGSLVNADSRKRDVVDPAAVCVRVSSLGYVRSWNFRSPTGFTALGLRRPQTEAEGGVAINGVVFPAGLDLAALDEREAGYQRVPVPPDCVMVLPPVREETPAEQDLRALLDGVCCGVLRWTAPSERALCPQRGLHTEHMQPPSRPCAGTSVLGWRSALPMASVLPPPPKNGPPTGLYLPEMGPNRFSNRR